jgi:hypothetical protein
VCVRLRRPTAVLQLFRTLFVGGTAVCSSKRGSLGEGMTGTCADQHLKASNSRRPRTLLCTCTYCRYRTTSALVDARWNCVCVADVVAQILVSTSNPPPTTHIALESNRRTWLVISTTKGVTVS